MKDRQNNDAAPTPEKAATPFFARFLEGQHGDAETQVAPSPMTLKYPSDRDEIDNYFPVSAEAATTNAAPSRMTLKYPSDRDEIDNYISH